MNKKKGMGLMTGGLLLLAAALLLTCYIAGMSAAQAFGQKKRRVRSRRLPALRSRTTLKARMNR